LKRSFQRVPVGRENIQGSGGIGGVSEKRGTDGGGLGMADRKNADDKTKMENCGLKNLYERKLTIKYSWLF